jgi:hypothetical protein
MAKGALYWRLKDEKTGKWSYKKVTHIEPYMQNVIHTLETMQEEE